MSNLFRRYPELREGIINLKSGTVFRGIIWKRRGEILILRNVRLLQDQDKKQQNPRAVDGEILLFRDQVDFIQVL